MDEQEFKILFPDYKARTLDGFNTREISSKIHHSERLLYRVLRDPLYFRKIIDDLWTNLSTRIESKSAEGKFKVYACGLLYYSTHATCEDCARPTIMAQNLRETGGVLRAIYTELNREESKFKAKENLRFNTIVLADNSYGEMSMLETESNGLSLEDIYEINIKDNPRGRFFEFLVPVPVCAPAGPIVSTIYMSGFKGKFFKTPEAVETLNSHLNSSLS